MNEKKNTNARTDEDRLALKGMTATGKLAHARAALPDLDEVDRRLDKAAQPQPQPAYVTAEALYKAEKARDTNKAHADALAEALRAAISALDSPILRHGRASRSHVEAWKQAKAALAAYEAAQ